MNVDNTFEVYTYGDIRRTNTLDRPVGHFTSYLLQQLASSLPNPLNAGGFFY